MKLLTPLGLLGLLSIVVLIIIYIIKPNYQQKYISSTFIWKLSLKYRKKKLPISKLRNILIIICQILILTSCALILAQPNQILKEQTDQQEVIVVLDSSASMRAMDEMEETRFERAVNSVLQFSNEIWNKNGIVSVILANDKPVYLGQRVVAEKAEELKADIQDLLEGENFDIQCSYGSSDMTAAMDLCQDVLIENMEAKVHVFTDTTYSYVPDGVKIHPISNQEEEWNVAILNAYAEMKEGFYTFVVDVACYGRDDDFTVNLSVNGANAFDSEDEGEFITFSESVECTGEKTKRIIFINDEFVDGSEDEENVVYYRIPSGEAIYSYQSVNIQINEEDALLDDNNFNIYNGQKEIIRIQYASKAEGFVSGSANPFMLGILYTMRVAYKDRWDIQITEVRMDEEPAVENFDLYIFEHTMPKTMPKDGVVYLINPLETTTGAGFQVSGTLSTNKVPMPLKSNLVEPHPLLNNVTVENIEITQTQNLVVGASYDVLMSINNRPVYMVKDMDDAKVVVLGCSLHYTNLPILKEFPIMTYNLFEYFFPATVRGNSFEVNENVSLNARGEELTVSMNDLIISTFDTFPSILTVDKPGTYILTQTTFAKKNITERIQVKIPEKESNIWLVEESLANPYSEPDVEDFLKDLLLYIAATLVALLFIEWWLQSRENM